MRTSVLTLMASILLPLTVSAQDDLYFTPTKEAVKAQQDAYDRTHGNYHIGRNVSVDEYNRRNRSRVNSQYAVVDGDSVLASDIIDFKPRPADGSDTLVVDTIYDDEEDFQNSYQLSRWDDYYCGYRPWFRPYNYWGVRYYGWYDPWYGPYWDPWYDPWFDPWYGPGWAWGPYYDPWYYDSWYWHRGYYPIHDSHTYWGVSRQTTPSGRSAGAPTGTGNHSRSNWANNAYAGSSHHGSSRGNSNYSTARRNGDVGTAAHSSRSSVWGGSSRNYGGNSSRSYSGNSNYSSGNNYSGSSNFGGSSSYSGGGGGYSGGGGHSSGGGHSGGGGGGHFGGGR